MTTPRNSANKPVIQETPIHLTNPLENKFDNKEFNDFIQDKGRRVYVEKAVRCPCVDAATGNALVGCQNCGNTGWVFFNKKETYMAITSLTRKTKFENWTEKDSGTINITARGIDRLAFMDRITVFEEVSIYNSGVLNFTRYGNNLMAFTTYYPIKVTDAFLFLNSKQPLKQLEEGIDFTINENRIVLNSVYNNYKTGGEASVINGVFRYYHFPCYNVIDIPREITVQRKLDCQQLEVLENLPINAIARKSHYLLDAPDANGNSLFDNSNLSEESSLIDYFGFEESGQDNDNDEDYKS